MTRDLTFTTSSVLNINNIQIKFIHITTHQPVSLTPSSPADNIWAVMTVWRIRYPYTWHFTSHITPKLAAIFAILINFPWYCLDDHLGIKMYPSPKTWHTEGTDIHGLSLILTLQRWDQMLNSWTTLFLASIWFHSQSWSQGQTLVSASIWRPKYRFQLILRPKFWSVLVFSVWSQSRPRNQNFGFSLKVKIVVLIGPEAKILQSV